MKLLLKLFRLLPVAWRDRIVLDGIGDLTTTPVLAKQEVPAITVSDLINAIQDPRRS